MVDTTDADGRYGFANLPFDTALTITVDAADLPAGFVPTYDADDITTPNVSVTTLTALAPDDLDQDFGYNGAGSIGDTVWLDRDASGTATVDLVDVGLPNVDVTIVWTNPTSGPDMSVTLTTDIDGVYLLDGLPHGDYTVSVDTATLPGGVDATFDADGLGTLDTSSTVLDSVTPDDLDQDFSYAGTGSLGDTVWRDDNGDGVIDTGEPMLGGVEVTLDAFDPITGVTFTLVTITAADGTYGFDLLPAAEYTVRVTRSTLPAGSAPTYDLDGAITADVAVVTLGAGENQPDVDFGYRIEADLVIDKFHAGDFTVGSSNTWTIEVTNDGPGIAAAPVRVVDELPEGVTFEAVDGDEWDCALSGRTLTCDYVDAVGTPVAMAVDARSSLDVTVVAELGSVPTVTNTASVSSPTLDPDGVNNVDADPTNVPLSVLDVDKSLVGKLQPGKTAVYRLVVTNRGPSTTRGTVSITDDLPASLSFVSASSDASGSACTSMVGIVTCTNVDSLAVDDVWTIDLTVLVSSTATGTVVNDAVVSGGNLVNGVPLSPTLIEGIYDQLAIPGSSLSDQLGVPTTTTSSEAASAPVTTPGILAFTGSNTLNMIIWAMMLLGLGGGLLLAVHRRRVQPTA